MSGFEQPNKVSIPPIHIDRPVFTQQKLNEWIGRPNHPGPLTFQTQAHKLAIGAARFLAPDCMKSKLIRKSLAESTGPGADRYGDNQVIQQDNRSLQSVSRRPCTHYARLFGAWLISFFPFIGILRRYDVKNYFVNDLIAGLTVGIMHVPQGKWSCHRRFVIYRARW